MDELLPNSWEKESDRLKIGQMSTCPVSCSLVCMSMPEVGGYLKSTGGSGGSPQWMRVAPDKGCGPGKDPKVCLEQFRSVMPLWE